MLNSHDLNQQQRALLPPSDSIINDDYSSPPVATAAAVDPTEPLLSPLAAQYAAASTPHSHPPHVDGQDGLQVGTDRLPRGVGGLQIRDEPMRLIRLVPEMESKTLRMSGAHA